MTALDIIQSYIDRGWQIVPVSPGLKRPIIKGWPNRKFGLSSFGEQNNIAVRVGRQSGDLVDADLDCEEAVELAPLYLPNTDARFGRPSKPRSHWLYIARDAAFETYTDPISHETLLELRADGRDGGSHLTLFPPSIVLRLSQKSAKASSRLLPRLWSIAISRTLWRKPSAFTARQSTNRVRPSQQTRSMRLPNSSRYRRQQ